MLNTTDDVVDFINRVSYKPGWTITATPDRLAELFGVHAVEITTHRRELDSSKPETGELVDVYGGAYLNLGPDGVDENTLAALVLWGLIGDEAHEAREFFRVEGKSPFHPHRDDGRRAWADALDTPSVRDLLSFPNLYGIGDGG